jgi:hypothetical protein
VPLAVGAAGGEAGEAAAAHVSMETDAVTGDRLMQGLVVVYIVVALVFGYEQNWAKMTYWIGAAIITGSVLVMK